jgi:hypothetical protein
MKREAKSQPIDDSPFDANGLLRDGYRYKMTRIAMLAPSLTLMANTPIIRREADETVPH